MCQIFQVIVCRQREVDMSLDIPFIFNSCKMSLLRRNFSFLDNFWIDVGVDTEGHSDVIINTKDK